MRRSLLALGLLLLTPLGLRGQVVEESFSRDPGPLDYIQGDSYEQWMIQSLAGDALVGLSAEGKLVPRLASGWKTRKDGALVFTLRADARFTDGSPVTGADVVWTWEEIRRNPKGSATKKAILEGATTGLDEEGRPWIRTPRPAGRLLLELVRVSIAQREHADRGSGPFSYRKEPGAWVFTRRDHFLKPKVDGIRFRLLPDAAGVLAALQKGWLTIGAPASRHPLEPPATHRVVTQALNAQLVVWSRVGVGPLRLLERWRRDAFPPQLLGQTARPSRGLWPTTLGHEAMAIESEAPLPKAPGTFQLLYAGGDDTVEKQLLALRERARKDGFTLELKPVELGLLQERLQQGAFQLAASAVVFDPNPWSVLEYLEPKGPMNFTGWSHPRLTQLVERIHTAGDFTAWRDLQAVWAQAPGAIPLLDYQSLIWVDRRLQVEPGPVGLYLATPGAAGWRWAAP